MIDCDTILSTTEDKMTLLQWLKKVEAALKDASATSFKVNKKGDATLTFSIVFADGTELESGEIILQQGESVASGAIVNGHLMLTLTNGEVLDCGELLNGNVNINGNLSVTGEIDADVLTSSEDKISAKKPVVELMTGYNYSQPTLSNYDVEFIYAGIVKNGNKLTLALALNITKRTGALNALDLGSFAIPASVRAKLYPVNIGGVNVLSVMPCRAIVNYTGSGVDAPVFVSKTNTGISLGMNATNLVTDTKYYVRAEATFLLSDNLLS